MITAQIIYLCILTLALGIQLADTAAGRASGKDFIKAAVIYVIQVALLYFGGFFRWS